MTATEHPDLARLIEAIQDAENAVQDGDMDDAHAAVDRILGPLVDPITVRAAAIERTDHVVEHTPELLLLAPQAVLRSAWMDGFTLGVLFQQRGGHTA